jgi:hypothetical protein
MSTTQTHQPSGKGKGLLKGSLKNPENNRQPPGTPLPLTQALFKGAWVTNEAKPVINPSNFYVDEDDDGVKTRGAKKAIDLSFSVLGTQNPSPVSSDDEDEHEHENESEEDYMDENDDLRPQTPSLTFGMHEERVFQQASPEQSQEDNMAEEDYKAEEAKEDDKAEEAKEDDKAEEAKEDNKAEKDKPKPQRRGKAADAEPADGRAEPKSKPQRRGKAADAEPAGGRAEPNSKTQRKRKAADAEPKKPKALSKPKASKLPEHVQEAKEWILQDKEKLKQVKTEEAKDKELQELQAKLEECKQGISFLKSFFGEYHETFLKAMQERDSIQASLEEKKKSDYSEQHKHWSTILEYGIDRCQKKKDDVFNHYIKLGKCLEGLYDAREELEEADTTQPVPDFLMSMRLDHVIGK